MVKAKKANVQKVDEVVAHEATPPVTEDVKAKEPAKTPVEAPKTKMKIIDY
jgi:hypothetical protein